MVLKEYPPFSNQKNWDAPCTDQIFDATGPELRTEGYEGVYIESKSQHHFFPFSHHLLFRTNLTKETITIGSRIPFTSTLNIVEPTHIFAMNKVDMELIMTDEALPPLTGKKSRPKL